MAFITFGMAPLLHHAKKTQTLLAIQILDRLVDDEISIEN